MPATLSSHDNKPAPAEPAPSRGEGIVRLMNFIVLVLSVMLIVWISVDTFEEVNFLNTGAYMTFQFWVCLFFILDFFVEMFHSRRKRRFFRHRLLFLLLSIPYLNIISHTGLQLSHNALYLVRFIPLARGALAIAIVFGYLSKNAITSLFASYISIMVLAGYFGSLIFFQWEHAVNPLVDSYWDALWWSAMNMSTVGCNIEPVTTPGRIVAVALPVLGMIVFPLFTVYLTNYVTRMVNTAKSRDGL